MAVGVLVSGDGFTSQSRVRFGAGVRMSPLITSHIMMILALDWNRSYHCPQLGPSSMGILNLLISILIELCLFLWLFLWMKGAYTSRCQMPKEVDSLLLGLSHEGAYTSRCQMPEYEQQIDGRLKWGWSINGWPYKVIWIYGMESGSWSSWWRVC